MLLQLIHHTLKHFQTWQKSSLMPLDHSSLFLFAAEEMCRGMYCLIIMDAVLLSKPDEKWDGRAAIGQLKIAVTRFRTDFPLPKRFLFLCLCQKILKPDSADCFSCGRTTVTCTFRFLLSLLPPLFLLTCQVPTACARAHRLCHVPTWPGRAPVTCPWWYLDLG